MLGTFRGLAAAVLSAALACAPQAQKSQPEKPQAEAKQPVDEQPADEQPADEQPADEQPADEQPADEQPADPQPADEQPADEQPADEQAEGTDTANDQYPQLYRRVGLRLSRAGARAKKPAKLYLELPYREGIKNAKVRDKNLAKLREIDRTLDRARISKYSRKLARKTPYRRGDYPRFVRKVGERLKGLRSPPHLLMRLYLDIILQFGGTDSDLRSQAVEGLRGLDRALDAL